MLYYSHVPGGHLATLNKSKALVSEEVKAVHG